VRERYITPNPDGFEIIEERDTDPFDGEELVSERTFIPSRLVDNPYLGKDYIRALRQSGSKRLVDAWLLGDWSVIEGQYFDNWSSTKHIIRPMPIPVGWARFRAMDWGFAAPFGVGWFATVSDACHAIRSDGVACILPRGCLVMYRELYGSDAAKSNKGVKWSAEQIADHIMAVEVDEPRNRWNRPDIAMSVADPAMFAEDGGPSLAEQMARRGVVFSPADNTRISRDGKMAGWTRLRHRLDGDEMGRPMICFFSTCRNTTRTLPALQHDPARPDDVMTDSEDHLADLTRYMCAASPWARKDWVDPLSPPNDLIADPADGVIRLTGEQMEKMWKQTERKNRRLSLSRGRI
jgi:hypothetical protein